MASNGHCFAGRRRRHCHVQSDLFSEHHKLLLQLLRVLNGHGIPPPSHPKHLNKANHHTSVMESCSLVMPHPATGSLSRGLVASTSDGAPCYTLRLPSITSLSPPTTTSQFTTCPLTLANSSSALYGACLLCDLGWYTGFHVPHRVYSGYTR